MKTLALLTLVIAFSAQASFGEETILSGEIHHGGYGGPVVKFTQFNGESAVLVGGQGGWIIDHTFVLGLGGFGLATDHHPMSVPTDLSYTRNELRTEFGYGGVMLSYIGMSDQLLHPTFDVLIGGGDIRGNRHDSDWSEFEDNEWEDHHWHSDGFFVVEPTVNAELNIVNFMRLNLGAGYRFISGVEAENWGFSNDDVDGFSASAMLKFGKF